MLAVVQLASATISTAVHATTVASGLLTVANKLICTVIGHSFAHLLRLFNDGPRRITSVPRPTRWGVLMDHCEDTFSRFLCANLPEAKKVLDQLDIDKLMIIIDFDRTITCARDASGREIPSCYGLLAEGLHCLFPDTTIRDQLRAIHDKYSRFELSEASDPFAKQRLMAEWWQLSNSIILQSGVTRSQIELIVERQFHKIRVRQGVDELFEFAKQHGIPVHVYSGGFDLFIYKILSKYRDQFEQNIFVTANRFQFDPVTNRLCGFEDPLIFGDKVGTLLKDKCGDDEQWSRRTRPHALIVGDMLGDSVMGKGLDCIDVELKIGIFNDFGQRSLTDCGIRSAYERAFTFTFCDEHTVDGVVSVLRCLSYDP